MEQLRTQFHQANKYIVRGYLSECLTISLLKRMLFLDMSFTEVSIDTVSIGQNKLHWCPEER